MSSEKKYYWLKLKENFFGEPDIKLLKSMPNGKDYVILYLQLQLMSLRSEGILRYKDLIPYTAEMLATLTDANVDVVKGAVDTFEKLKLVEIWDDGTIYLSEMQKLIGNESESAERVRRHRQQQKLLTPPLHSNDDETNSNTEIEIEKELEIDTDTEKELNTDPPSENPTPKKSRSKKAKSDDDVDKVTFAKFVKMTQEEKDKLTEEFGAEATNRMIEVLNNYKGSSGKTYKSDYLAIKNWVVERVREEFAKQRKPFGVKKEGVNGGINQVDYDSLSIDPNELFGKAK